MARDYPAKGSGPRKKPHPREELARAVEELGRLPFPARSADDRADLLHAELLLYDSSVGEAVMALLTGERPDNDALRPNPVLRSDLEALAASGDAEAAADARAYLEYLERLDALLQLARALRERRGAR